MPTRPLSTTMGSRGVPSSAVSPNPSGGGSGPLSSPTPKSGSSSSSSTGLFSSIRRPVAEAWASINFTQRMTLLSLIVFGFLIVCFSVLLSLETNDLSTVSDRNQAAIFYKQLGNLFITIESEAKISLGNALWSIENTMNGADASGATLSPPPVTQEQIWAAQLATDQAMQQSFSTSFGSLSDSVLRKLFRSTVLADTRQKINYGTLTAAQLQSRREDYNVLLRDLANAMFSVSGTLLSPHVQAGFALQSALASVGVGYALRLSEAAGEVISMGPLMTRAARTGSGTNTINYTNTYNNSINQGNNNTTNNNTTTTSPLSNTFIEAFNTNVNTFLHSLFRLEGLTRSIMGGGAGGETIGYQTSRTALTRSAWQLADALAAGSGGGTWTEGPPIDLTAQTEGTTSSPADNRIMAGILANLPESYTELGTTREEQFQILYSVLIAFSVIGILYVLTMWVNHQRDIVANEVRARNATIMHAVSVRVAEFVDAFATFSLVVPAPPRVMQGTPVGVVELQLQQCLASLKTIAPSLPPLLFPTLFAKQAAAVSEVNDSKTASERILNFIAPRDTLRRERITLLTESDVQPEGNIYYPPMRDLTALGARLTNAVVLTVDTFFFHDVCSVQRRQTHISTHQHNQTQLQRERWAHSAYQRVVACIEECVYQYGGQVHFAGLDRVTAVWIVDGDNGYGGGSGGGANKKVRSVAARVRRRLDRFHSSSSGGGSRHALLAPSASSRSHGPKIGIFDERDDREDAAYDDAEEEDERYGNFLYGDNNTNAEGGGARGGGIMMGSPLSNSAAAAGGGDGMHSPSLLSSPPGGAAASPHGNMSSFSPNGVHHHHHHHSGGRGANGSIVLKDYVLNMAPFLRPTFTPVYNSSSMTIPSDVAAAGGLFTDHHSLPSSSSPSPSSSSSGGTSDRGGTSHRPHHHHHNHHHHRHHQKGFKAPNACDAPAMCALAVASRLTALRKQCSRGISDPFKLWGSVPVSVGVTAGPVLMGTFGTDDRKTLQLFGDPLVNGLPVARVNQYSLTSVVCDEMVKRVIEAHRYCKPIETLPHIGRIYELIPPHIAAGEGDVEAKLAAYNTAYDLYEGRFYREALRAFRAYTKQYGYDRSVERLQGVITGL